jgi:hypothetical protein
MLQEACQNISEMRSIVFWVNIAENPRKRPVYTYVKIIALTVGK